MRITLPSGTAAALSRPNSPAPDGGTRGLVIATDIWGLRPLYDDLADRLADEWGVTVCVPEPFPGQDIPMEPDPRFAAVRANSDDRVLGDLVLAADATGAGQVGLIGFCMGGMYTLKAAALDRFHRLVPFYGMIRLPLTMQGPGHRQPLDALAGGHPERVLAIIGEQDPYTPPDDVVALGAAGVAMVRFPEAAHAFVHDPSRDSYRADDAAAAWAACRSWLGV